MPQNAEARSLAATFAGQAFGDVTGVMSAVGIGITVPVRYTDYEIGV